MAKLKQEKIQQLIEQGHEISNLDAKEIKLDSEEIATAIAEIDQLITTSDPAVDQLLVDVKVI